MNRVELRTELERSGVPRGAYTLDGVGDEAYCLVEEVQGFAVFYSERGHRNGERVHVTEADACRDLLTRLGAVAAVQRERRARQDGR